MTTLSYDVWKLKDQKILFNITWAIRLKAYSFSSCEIYCDFMYLRRKKWHLFIVKIENIYDFFFPKWNSIKVHNCIILFKLSRLCTADSLFEFIALNKMSRINYWKWSDTTCYFDPPMIFTNIERSKTNHNNWKSISTKFIIFCRANSNSADMIQNYFFCCYLT